MLEYLSTIWQHADEYADIDEAVNKRRRIADEDLLNGIEAENANKTESVHDKICDRIASELGGKREKRNTYGRSDVSTIDFEIEVKPIADATHALGQALSYAFASKKAPWVHLFGSEPSICGKLRPLFAHFHVKLTYEQHLSSGLTGRKRPTRFLSNSGSGL